MLDEPVLKNTYLKLSNLLTLWVNFYIASTADYLCLDVDPPKAVGNIVSLLVVMSMISYEADNKKTRYFSCISDAIFVVALLFHSYIYLQKY